MGTLRVNKVIYSGQKYFFESEEFDKNIVLIEGDNGTGKSTLCNLIYFGLGGEVKIFRKDSSKRHEQITSDKDNYVDLYISISESIFLLRRYIDDNEISIIPCESQYSGESNKKEYILSIDKELKYPVNRNNGCRIFSDWILDELKISVVELYHGYKTFKINFTDLLRLMYHDQQPDPESIYKRLDTNSTYVADSEVARKAIFELLIGKSYSSYYDAIVKEKTLMREKSIAKGVVDEYTILADRMRNGREVKNSAYLKEEIQEKEAQIDKLHLTRNAFKANRKLTSTSNNNVQKYKSIIVSKELSLSNHKATLISLFDEKYNLVSLEKEVVAESQQLQKIIYSHDQLNLFTVDTCPYCLGKVHRKPDECVCGSHIDEEQYEKFIYTSKEYNEILKTKIKSLETIKAATFDCEKEIKEIKTRIDELEIELDNNNSKLADSLDDIDQNVDIESLNDIDDKILDLREDISVLSQLFDIEIKLSNYQKSYDDKSDEVTAAVLNRKKLEASSQIDISSKVRSFSEKYNELMIDTLRDCRTAKIRPENYLPSINEGLYKEASSLVSIRLMYYITLMHMSLIDESISFPRFLLVDTPDTAGIEPSQLIKCISKFQELEEYQLDYQVILSTGLNKYPKGMEENRVLYMPEKKIEFMLLKRVV